MNDRHQASRLAFSAEQRVRRRREFERVFRGGRRMADDCVTLWALPNGLEHARLGLIVGRRHGNAVRRNRIKRLVREAFRLARPDLPAGYDVLCAPRPGVRLTLERVDDSLKRLMRRVDRASPRA